jgi:gliding motility-associated-like protein
MPKKIRSLLIALALLALQPVKATHIVGGEMTYTYLGNNQYKLRLDLYIDCINGNPEAINSDRNALFAIYYGNTREMVPGYPVSVARSGPVRITKTNYNCIAVLPNACVDHYWYERTVTLAPRTGGYYVSFQRCCRNGTITNIVDPGGSGANYWNFIPNANDVGNNNSAVFKELPPNFLCTNTALRFDHSAKDADGDSLVYSLTTPYTGGDRDFPRPDDGVNGMMDRPLFDLIQWRNAYTATDPINGFPKMSIDPETGYLTLTPTLVGQFVVGISVKEYRKGKFLNETIRDYQFNVQACVINVMASFFAPKFICGFNYSFTNYSQGAQRYFWDFGVANRTDDTSNATRPLFTFPEPGEYTVKLIAFKNNCSDTFKLTVNVVKPVEPNLPQDTVLCPGATLTLNSDITGDAYWWNTGAKTNSITVNAPGSYIIGVSQKTCVWYDTMQIDYDRTVVDAYGDTLFCSNETFTKTIGAKPVDKATYRWSNNVNEREQTISNKGWYTVKMRTQYGCESTDSVRVDQYSDVNVSVSDTTACFGRPITFKAIYDDPTAQISWSNGSLGPTMTTSQSGAYVVKATVGLCSKIDNFQYDYFPRELELGPDLVYCDRIDTILSAPQSDFKSVVWNDEITGQNYRLREAGFVKISVITKNGCIERDSLMVRLFQSPLLNLGPDTTMCLSENPILDAGFGMRSYKWNNGQTGRYVKAYDSGFYVVEITSSEGCRSIDSIWINKRKDLFSSDIYMPNAFTPNGDGLNDLYPMNQYQVKGAEYRLWLYNRWGEKLAEFSHSDGNWDGLVKGNSAPEGVYVYKITWLGCDNQRRTLYGDFTLLR